MVEPERKRGGPQIDGVPLWQFSLRVVWVAVRIVVSFLLLEQGATFFYQGF